MSICFNYFKILKNPSAVDMDALDLWYWYTHRSFFELIQPNLFYISLGPSIRAVCSADHDCTDQLGRKLVLKSMYIST